LSLHPALQPFGGALTRPPRKRSGVPAIDLLKEAARRLDDTKAEDVVALDLREATSMCDYFLIASGTSEQHVRALARAVEEVLLEHGAKAWHREGAEGRRWILLDYVDVVVHIFHHETRDYYRLEHLWGDAKRVQIPTRAAESEAS